VIILEGDLPEKEKTWHVLIPRSPGMALGKTWQLALLLARAGLGNVLLAVAISEDSEELRQEARETMLDNAETELYEQALNGNTTALIFLLKTQGKGRGYVERQEQVLSGEVTQIQTIEVVRPDD
jgi:hypothetical protein